MLCESLTRCCGDYRLLRSWRSRCSRPVRLGARSSQARRRARGKAAELLDHVGLVARVRHRPARLSGGEQQRVAIVRALANDPRVLLADEPTGNLDHATGDDVLRTLLDLVRHTGLAALIATHNLDLARRLDRIVGLEDGRLKPLS